MALKDLKSDLSKFRKPQPTPLSDKPRVEPSTFNTAPLSDKVQGKKTPTPNPTPEKLGVTPSEVKQGDKFKGETTPKPMSLEERFLGQTETTPVSQGDKFKGETTPTEVAQGDKFKGETTPTEVNQSEKFKGETTPTEVNQSEKFKGETTPNDFRFTQQFLGETEPKEFTFSQQFLGETTPTTSDLSSKFLGETEQVKSDLSSKFLGETETTPINQGDKFKGETEQVKSDLSSKFLGETETTPINQGDKFKGETTPNDFKFNPNLDSQGKDPKFVDFITDDNAKGFSPYQQPKNNSTFVGVDPSQTSFDNTNSLLSQFGSANSGISFHAGYGKYKVGEPTGDTQRYSPDGSRYIDSYTSIGSMMEKRQSPSFLDEMYHKFNLKDDSANQFSLIKSPYILRGIQRKKITKGEPQKWGFGFPIDDGLVRGGIVASTERALVDVARMGSFFLSVKGLLWGVTQVGLQRTQKYGKTWTPINLLANIATQHAGLKFDRPGILPVGDETFKYEALKPKATLTLEEGVTSPGGLSKLYNELDTTLKGLVFTSLIDPKGGFDSIYGLGVSGVSRKTDTFDGVKTTTIGLKSYEPFVPVNTDNEKEGTLVKQTRENSQIPIDSANEGKPTEGVAKSSLERKTNLLESEGITKGSPDIKDYQAVSYGKIRKYAEDNSTGAAPIKPNDFRTLDDKHTRKKTAAQGQDYSEDYIEKRVKFGTPGRILPDDKKQRDANYATKADYKGYYDEGNASKINEKFNDLIPLRFKIGSEFIQFRGTISGLSENFSPTYSEIKYNGRAEPVYVYDSFKRDITFNFKVYATSRVEMEPMWTKLERLSTYTMPNYVSSGYTSPGELKLTIGHLYKDTPTILTSLGYTYSDDVPYDVDYEIPMGIDISVGCTMLGNSIHAFKKEDIYSFGFSRTK